MQITVMLNGVKYLSAATARWTRYAHHDREVQGRQVSNGIGGGVRAVEYATGYNEISILAKES